jgi:hypothetical protein
MTEKVLHGILATQPVRTVPDPRVMVAARMFARQPHPVAKLVYADRSLLWESLRLGVEP